MSKRSKPTAEIVQYEQLKAAAGGSGSSGSGGYRSGQKIVCKIMNSEPGGYVVSIPNDNMPGFLPTSALLHPGAEVLAQYVCVHRGRVMVSALFSRTETDITRNRSWLVQPLSVD